MHDEYSSAKSDLRSGKSDTLRFVECFVHIVQKCSQSFVEFINRLADFVETLVLVGQNFSQCHFKNPFIRSYSHIAVHVGIEGNAFHIRQLRGIFQQTADKTTYLSVIFTFHYYSVSELAVYSSI